MAYEIPRQPALDAQSAPGHGMGWRWGDAHDPAAFHMQEQAATAAAIDTGGMNFFHQFSG